MGMKSKLCKSKLSESSIVVLKRGWVLSKMLNRLSDTM